MSSKALIIANENEFNRSILKDNAFYFETPQDIKQHIEQTDKKSQTDKIENCYNQINKQFSWDIINKEYLDRNFAQIFIVWDRMFGTFQKEEKADPVIYGITSNIKTYNLFKIAFHEFHNIWKDVKSAPSLKTKLGYIFMAPGWSHDGRSKTSDQLRAEEGIS